MARTANRRAKAEEALLSKESGNSFQTAIYTRISRDKKLGRIFFCRNNMERSLSECGIFEYGIERFE